MLIHRVFGHLPHKLDTQRIRECQSENISPEKIKKWGCWKKKWHRADGTFNYTISRKSILNRIIKYPVDENLAFIEVLVKVCHYYNVVILTTANNIELHISCPLSSLRFLAFLRQRRHCTLVDEKTSPFKCATARLIRGQLPVMELCWVN